MPPKNTGMSKKTEKKLQDKVIEDKTFGLKNKNKSKVVQNFVKSVTTQVKGQNVKGGESKRLADEFAAKEEKKKDAEKQAFLGTLFKTVKKVQEEVEEEEPEVIADDKYEDIDFFVDQREQVYGQVTDDPIIVEEMGIWRANKDKTEKVCRFFIDAVENNKYGWKWNCPNGITCIYKHALPAGFVLKKDRESGDKKGEDGILEERLEIERALLQEGTPVTLERFQKWKADKKAAKEKETEKKRLDEAKKTGGKGLNVLSGKALFTYDPTLFKDDDEAAGNDDYEEEVIPEEEFKEGDEYEEYEEEEPVGKEWGAEGKTGVSAGEGTVSKKVIKKRRKVKKNEDDMKINEDVFMDGDDVDLPEDM